MRGFQPAAHLVPKYADGGLVQRALGLIGGRKKQIDEAVKVASQDTRQASAPAPAPPPAPVKTTQDGKFDEKRTSKDNPAGIGFANGGQVRRPRGFVVGPGTGTSDSIPAQLSNGEYVLPADTVRAVGVDKLDALREATHKPVRGFAPKAAPEEPRQFFSDGGLVDEENASRFVKVPPGIGGNPGANAPVRPAPVATPAPRGFTPNAAPPAQPPAPAPADSGGLSYRENNQAVGRDIKDSWNKGNYGEAIGKTVAGTVGMFSTPIIDGGLAAWDGAKGFGRGLLGVESPPGNATPAKPSGTTPKQDATASTPTHATATLNSVMEVQRRRDAINGTTDTNTNTNAKTNTNDAAAPPAPEPKGREVLPGAYEHGRGKYSDRADGMGFSPGFTGKPNAQNDAAAEALSARSQQESTNRLAQQQYQREVADAQAINAAGTQYAPNSGLQHQWMSDLRDPRTLALRNASVGSKIFQNKGEELMANKARQARVAGVQAAIGGQMHDAQAAQTAALQSKNTLASNLATEQMRQDGENQRSSRRLAIDQQRLGIEAGKAAQESTARGFDIRAAQRQEDLYKKYDAAKTPEEKSAIAQQIRDLSGKNTESPWKIQVTPTTKNVDGSTTDGSIYRYNTQTGVVERVDGSGAGKPPPAPQDSSKRIKGNPYTAPNGQTVIWNGDGWLS